MTNITGRSVARYLLLPAIVPRCKSLFTSGFGFASFFMAQTYRAVRLLPAGHPYLSTSNMGKFGIQNVISEAYRNLKLDWKNIDQILVFVLLAVGIVMLAFQFALLGFALFAQSAHAAGFDDFFGFLSGILSGFGLPTYSSGPPLPGAPGGFAQFFVTANPQQDVAFILLDRVFGIPGLFNSCVSTGAPCLNDMFYNVSEPAAYDEPFPFPFHGALHEMFALYSTGLLIVGVLILSYYAATIVAETAHTGTPFGKRFNHAWAPVRLVVAMGLLIPFGATGLNSAQWIVLYSAKMGSGFATNGWNVFVMNAFGGSNTMLGEKSSLIGRPTPPSVNTLMEFATLLSTCVRAEKTLHNRDVQAWIINANQMGPGGRMLLNGSSPVTYEDALEFTGNRNILYRFGENKDDDSGNPIHNKYDGEVRPYCGEVELQITDVSAESTISKNVLAGYHLLIQSLWQYIEDGGYTGDPEDETCDAGEGTDNLDLKQIGENVAARYVNNPKDENVKLPDTRNLECIRRAFQYTVDCYAGHGDCGMEIETEDSTWIINRLMPLGWGGAAIWYNKIAEMNGNYLSAVHSLPAVGKYPEVMEKVMSERQRRDQDITGSKRFQPFLADGQRVEFDSPADYDIANALFQMQALWGDHYSPVKVSGNVFRDIINLIFGTEGLFNMRENQDVHPLAQLAGVGKSLVESAVRNIGYSFFAGVGGGLATLFEPHLVGNLALAASKFATQVATIALGIGFVLFYVVPFLPFIYFFFAVGGWIKGVFEAMIGAPLWALAHLRIDGNGLPGDAAMGGYYLIFEIFLRPILIVVGLLAAITIFTAQVKILNEIWPLVTSNLTGFDMETAMDPDMPAGADNEIKIGESISGTVQFFRSVIDQFFFTIIYTFVVYMMAMASFKLIDQIPNHVLQWLGAGIASFNEQDSSTPEKLVRNTMLGSNYFTNAIRGAQSGAASAAKETAQAVRGPDKPLTG